jgi:hypothetical protein
MWKALAGATTSPRYAGAADRCSQYDEAAKTELGAMNAHSALALTSICLQRPAHRRNLAAIVSSKSQFALLKK